MTIDFNESFSYFNLYLATILWFMIATAAMVDSWRMHASTKDVWKMAQGLTNGRRIMAKGRYDVSWWFLAGFIVSWLIGLAAMASLFAVTPPRPDTTFYTFLLRYMLIFVIFAFWRAKRVNLRIVRELDDIEDAQKEHQLHEQDGYAQ